MHRDSPVGPLKAGTAADRQWRPHTGGSRPVAGHRARRDRGAGGALRRRQVDHCACHPGESRVLVLDEATSALDIETEELVHRALMNLIGGPTTNRHRTPPGHPAPRGPAHRAGAGQPRRIGHPPRTDGRRRHLPPLGGGPAHAFRRPRARRSVRTRRHCSGAPCRLMTKSTTVSHKRVGSDQGDLSLEDVCATDHEAGFKEPPR